MNKNFIFLLMLCLLQTSFSAQAENVKKQELRSNWQFRQYNLGEWLPATVPGTVHTDLLANKKIEDPYYRVNEKQLQWIDKVNWEYKTTFHIDNEFLSQKNKRLTFLGLDTYAKVFLNDQELGNTDNMFRTWEFDISDKLKKGANELRIVFTSPVNKGLSEMERYGLMLPADNDQSPLGGMGLNRVSVFTRKAPYNYGWDWGPRLVTSGVWRPVVLEGWNDAKIDNLFIRQQKVDKKSAELDAQVTIIADTDKEVKLEISDNGKVQKSQSVKLTKGENNIQLPLTIKNPRLWWSNGLGEPNLYTFNVQISDGAQIIDKREVTTGLRSIRLIRNKDKDGETFYFELNGVPVFAKGANYIPNDAFLPRVTKADYEKVIADAADAHMNMLRIWGGGIYEDDYFYELCDKNGIMIWQDFMFACAMYPGNDEFLESVKHEAIDNVVRLRNHPCIALWCGNNEIGVAWRHGTTGGWGWKEKYTPEQQNKIFKAYTDIFHEVLPEVVSAYGNGDDYWASSPMAGPGSLQFETQPGTSGDNHYWGVWHQKHKFEEYDKYLGRFISEYGFQSFPEFETVKKYTLPEDYNIESEVMASHQRSGIGNLRIKEYMGWYYNIPDDFEQFLYMSQVLQAKAMHSALQTHRRSMPYCMGSLLWQLNDCWPVASWSTTDYYHNWKAAQYAAKDACKPVIVAPKLNDGQLELWIANDHLKPFNGTYTIELLDFSGKSLNSMTGKFTAKANTAGLIVNIAQTALLKGQSENTCMAVVTVREGKTILDEQNIYFTQPKNMELPEPTISIEPVKVDGKQYIRVSTDKLACNVMFYMPETPVFFFDNYMDLLPGRTYTIELQSKQTLPEKLNIQTRYIR